MEIGIDSFISASGRGTTVRTHTSMMMGLFLDRVVYAEEVGLDVFGVGEYHREDFLDSAPIVILAAAAARTSIIRLTSAATILSTADPVRVYESFATLDLISNGRAEIVTGSSSFSEAFALFGIDQDECDTVYKENLGLLMALREEADIQSPANHLTRVRGQGAFPNPIQQRLPIWLGSDGSPDSFVLAGTLGLPVMISVMGGKIHRFRPLVDLYRETGCKAGHPLEQLRVGLHSFGYVGRASELAADEFYRGYANSMATHGRKRGWPHATRRSFDEHLSPLGAYLIGSPDQVIEKVTRHSQALGGISRVTLYMDAGQLSHEQMLSSIDLLGKVVAPALRHCTGSLKKVVRS